MRILGISAFYHETIRATRRASPSCAPPRMPCAASWARRSTCWPSRTASSGRRIRTRGSRSTTRTASRTSPPGVTSSAAFRMLSAMNAHASAAVDHLLSTRARLAPPPATRPLLDPLYDFGAGQPDPGSFPYDGLVEATARVMKAEGAAALMYGEYQGYRAAARTGVREVRAVRGPESHARAHPDLERLRPRPGAGLQRLRGRGRPHHHRGADLLGHPPHHPPARARDPRRSRGRRGHGDRRRPRAPRAPAPRGAPLQAHLHHRQLPEPRRPQPLQAAAPRADRAGPPLRHGHPRR